MDFLIFWLNPAKLDELNKVKLFEGDDVFIFSWFSLFEKMEMKVKENYTLVKFTKSLRFGKLSNSYLSLSFGNSKRKL